MQEWLLQVWAEERRTVLFVTHDIDEAIFLSDRIVVLSDRPGTVVADLSVELPRPRRLATLTEPTFMETKRTILNLLHHEGESA